MPWQHSRCPPDRGRGLLVLPHRNRLTTPAFAAVRAHSAVFCNPIAELPDDIAALQRRQHSTEHMRLPARPAARPAQGELVCSFVVIHMNKRKPNNKYQAHLIHVRNL